MNRFVYCPGGVVVFDRPKNSMLGPLPGVNQGSTYVPFSVPGFLFVLFLLPDFSQKKICINRFLCLLALTARWGVALQSEKSDLRIILRCPGPLNNKLRIWYRVFVKQPGLRMTGTAASRKQEWVMYLGQKTQWTQTLLCGKILW